MSVLVWLGVGLAGLLAVSLLVGLAIARMLGTIGDEIAQLLETEPWTSAPLTRAVDPPVDDLSPRRARRATRSSRTRS
jgi:hypothetical protein